MSFLGKWAVGGAWHRPGRRSVGVAAVALAAATATAAAAVPVPAALYASECAACHGVDGRGNAMIDAPALAGLDAAYIQRQLHGYRVGFRGADEKDPEGMEMRPMAVALSEAQGAALAQWLAALPIARRGGATQGDADLGKRLYAPCAACHGPAGEGVEALAAPRLTGQASWYLRRQMHLFISGARGSHPEDHQGRSMRVSVAEFNPDDVPHILAWLEALADDATVR